MLGSSDPHGLQLNDDRAPRARRRPTLHVGRHLEEEAERLRVRPLPRLNVAPATDEKPPPPAPSPLLHPDACFAASRASAAACSFTTTYLRMLPGSPISGCSGVAARSSYAFARWAVGEEAVTAHGLLLHAWVFRPAWFTAQRRSCPARPSSTDSSRWSPPRGRGRALARSAFTTAQRCTCHR